MSGANENAAGGVIVTPDQELIVRGIGRATSVADLAVALWRTAMANQFACRMWQQSRKGLP
ncbi:hypothetical protein MZ909_07810 [Thermosynechococcus sp. B0]|nr:hypothetical protein MZ909_07810 [Thermosynechococcus sp. B0]WJI25646.1 hypothetical protein M0644_07880 [Thermosynechococcus sp. B1]